MTRQVHTDEAKNQAVKLADYRGNDRVVEEQLGLSGGSICRWRAAGFGKDGPAITAVDELLAKLGAPPAEVREPIPTFAASTVIPDRWELVWRDRFPSTALSVIAGRPGLGKSTLEAAIAAELSAEGLVGVISNLEDDIHAVTVPRLVAAGADLSKILLVVRESAPQLPEDFDRLEQLVRSSGARYMILDPIAAHFTPESRVHSRAGLARLMAIAQRYRCAIVGIHHSTKSHSIYTAAIEAIGGPQGGLSGAARAVYLYGKDPRDEDRRALACVKINGVDTPPTLMIEHETVEVSTGGMLLEAGVLRMVEESNIAAEDVMGRGASIRDRDAECQEWLALYLAAGENCSRASNEVRAAAKRVGFSWQTMLRSAVEVGAVKAKVGFGADQLWYWRLPDNHPLRDTTPAGELEGPRA